MPKNLQNALQYKMHWPWVVTFYDEWRHFFRSIQLYWNKLFDTVLNGLISIRDRSNVEKFGFKGTRRNGQSDLP